jgi:RNA polymerase sigma-70 factor (ECF subfamily)
MPTAMDLDELYQASYRRLVVQIYATCGDLAQAEDAVQDAFVTALRKQPRLARVTNPEAWIRTVALNSVRHGWRHASVVRRYQAQVPGPLSPVDVGPEHVAIVTALQELDAGQREAVVLHYLADLPVAEVAVQLAWPRAR